MMIRAQMTVAKGFHGYMMKKTNNLRCGRGDSAISSTRRMEFFMERRVEKFHPLPLNYASPPRKQTSIAKSISVFMPALIAILIMIFCFWLRFPSYFIDSFCLVAFWAAEITTLLTLCFWRRELRIFSIVGGCIIVVVGAIYLAIMTALFLGILDGP